MTEEKGVLRLIEFLFSGEPGAFVLWAILGYGIWASLFGSRDSGGDVGSWGDGDGDGGV